MESRQSIVSRLLYRASKVINGASNDIYIMDSLRTVDYDETSLTVGSGLWTLFAASTESHDTGVAEQKELGHFSKRLKRITDINYGKNLRIARSHFKNDPETIAALKLDVNRARGFEERFNQAKVFYQSILADEEILTVYAYHGVKKERLEMEFQLLLDSFSAKQNHDNAIGRSQALKLERDKAMAALNNWLTGFKEILIIALADNPQQLEKLGIRVYSKGYKKKPRPSVPVEPGDPVDPVDPGDPTPGEPGDPTPGEPGDPTPGEPGEPGEPNSGEPDPNDPGNG